MEIAVESAPAEWARTLLIFDYMDFAYGQAPPRRAKLRVRHELPSPVIVGIIFALLMVAPFWIIVFFLVRLAH